MRQNGREDLQEVLRHDVFFRLVGCSNDYEHEVPASVGAGTGFGPHRTGSPQIRKQKAGPVEAEHAGVR